MNAMGKGNSNAVKGKNGTQAEKPASKPSDSTADFAALLNAKAARDAASKQLESLTTEKEEAIATATATVEEEYAERETELAELAEKASANYEKCKEKCGID